MVEQATGFKTVNNFALLRELGDGHFARALKEAERSRLPMLELLAARDWGEHLLEPNGRDCGRLQDRLTGGLLHDHCSNVH